MPGRPTTIRLPRPRLLGLLGGVGVAAAAILNTLQVRSMRSRARALADVQHDPAYRSAGPGTAVRTVAVLGDSAARGFAIARRADTFSARLALGLTGPWAPSSVRVMCHAVDGARTIDVTRDQISALSGTEDLIVVGVGVNDGLRGTRAVALRKATQRMVDGVQAAAPTAQVVVVMCPDLQAAPGFPWPLSMAIGARLRRVARIQGWALAHRPAVMAIPLGAANADHIGADGFHPGPAGQQAMADAVVAAVTVGFRPTSGGSQDQETKSLDPLRRDH